MNKLLIAASSLLMAILLLFFSCKKEEKSSQEEVLKGLEFADDYYILLEGEKLNLAKNLLFTPESLEDEAEVEWSSEDEDVAVVSSKGKLTAVSKGSTTIYAKSMGKTASCDVLVKRINIQSFSIESDLGEVGVNQKIYLKVSNLTPSNASVSTLNWSSSVSSVTPLFDVEAGSWYVLTDYVGTIKLTAKNSDGTCTRTCTINSVVKTLKSITIEPAGLVLLFGETATLKTTLAPSDAAYQEVTWSTSDASIATVSETGIVKAGSKEGEATIKLTHTKKNAKDVTLSATCKVTVSKCPAATGFTLDKSTLSLPVSSTGKISIATITPTGADPNTIAWTSSNSDIVTVSAVKGSGSTMPYCTIKSGLKPGTATVTASVNGVTKTCVVTVEKVALKNFYLNKKEVVLWGDSKTQLTATFYPTDASVQKVEYKSSNPYELKVASDGTITPLEGADGSYTITATADGITKEVPVVVLPSWDFFEKKTFWGVAGTVVFLTTAFWNYEKYKINPIESVSNFKFVNPRSESNPLLYIDQYSVAWFLNISTDDYCTLAFDCEVKDTQGESRVFKLEYDFKCQYVGVSGIGGSTVESALMGRGFSSSCPLRISRDTYDNESEVPVRVWYKTSNTTYSYYEEKVTLEKPANILTQCYYNILTKLNKTTGKNYYSKRVYVWVTTRDD